MRLAESYVEIIVGAFREGNKCDYIVLEPFQEAAFRSRYRDPVDIEEFSTRGGWIGPSDCIEEASADFENVAGNKRIRRILEASCIQVVNFDPNSGVFLVLSHFGTQPGPWLVVSSSSPVSSKHGMRSLLFC